jgi:uncharacterized caspase-like protein
MRALLGVVLAVWLTSLLFSQPAFAEKRVALIIGNSSYQNVPQLRNPANDSAAIAGMLKSAGFDLVDSQLNLSAAKMRRVLREFGARTRDADVAVIYYAGHGIELEGNNYLIPIDARLETDVDVYDETVSLDRVLVAVEPAKQLRLIILDACRDNPFANKMKRTFGSRGIMRGLARVEPSSPNTMIAFAARAGSTAADGDGANSPFATALVNHLVQPGLDLRKAFGFVRDDVLKATNNGQEPFIYGSLGGDDVTLVPAAPVAAPADQDGAIRRDYELALQIGTKSVWDSFISKYPAGFYTDLAKAQRDNLAAEAARIEQVKTAEQARQTAELARKVEEAKVAAAERAKAAARAKATEDAKVAEAAKVKAEEEAKADAEKKAKEEKLAALTPPAVQPTPPDLVRSLQAELRRVGCGTGPVDGNWSTASQQSLDLFNKYAGLKLDVTVANVDALEAVKGKTIRVCPLVCAHGFRADGEQCTGITCRAGYEVGDDNTCERIKARKPTTSRVAPARRERSQRATLGPEPDKPQAAGQILCNTAGCRPVKKGCHLDSKSKSNLSGPGGQIEVCG